MNRDTPAPQAIPAARGPNRFRVLLRCFMTDYLIGIGINTVCAIIVSYLLDPAEKLWESWVFSMCIGTTVIVLTDGGRLAIWGQEKPNKSWCLGIILVSVPIAYFFGSFVAFKILDIPLRNGINHQIDHAYEFLIFITVVCLLVTWLHWNHYELLALKAQAEEEKARAAAIEKQAVQAQLQLLQAQIEPHMLFNTLANLQGLIAIDPVRAQYMLEQLIHYLRASLSSSRAEKTTLIHEFELMRAYLELMSVRMGSRLSYTLQLPSSLSEMIVPPMLLQPLVENAIKHGLEAKIEGRHVDVQAVLQENRLILTISDTGLGLETSGHAAYLHHGTHLGLTNVRERLQALYGDQATFQLLPNHPAGAISRFTLPLSP